MKFPPWGDKLPLMVVGSGRANSRRRREEDKQFEEAYQKAGELLGVAEQFKPSGMSLEELKTYTANLRDRFLAEKHDWRGEHILYENAYIKGMERAIELMEKGLRP